MNESAMTRTLLGRARQAEPEAFVWKITEKISGGKPDALYLGAKRKTWLEFKKCTSLQNPNPVTQLTALQVHTLNHLARLGQDVLVVGYVGSWKTVVIYVVTAMFNGGPHFHLREVATTDPRQHPLLAYFAGAELVRPPLTTPL